jgi:hypothetical protein
MTLSWAKSGPQTRRWEDSACRHADKKERRSRSSGSVSILAVHVNRPPAPAASPRPRGRRGGLHQTLRRVVGVPRGGAELAVAEHRTDLKKRRPRVRQRRRQAVA